MNRESTDRLRAALVLALASLPVAGGCGLFARGGGGSSAADATTEAEITLAPGFGTAAQITGTTHGSAAASRFASSCRGHVTEQPTAVLHVTEAIGNVSVLASSSEDTTLVVRHPDGSVSCDDDSGGSRNPLVAGALVPGDHEIWVGTYASGRRASFTLSVTESAGGAESGRRGRGAPESGGPFQGTATIENRTGMDICRIESNAGPEYAVAEVSIPAGGTGTLEVSRTLTRLWLVGCDGRVLFGGPNPGLTTPGTSSIPALDVATITLLEAGSTPAEEAGHRVLVAEPRTAAEYLSGVVEGLVPSPSDAMNRAPLRAQSFAALQEGGRARRWPETFVAMRLVSADWEIFRHRVSGVITHRAMQGVAIARFPSGLCQATPVFFTQQHDGRDFAGAVSFASIGGNHQVPCAIADAATRASDWAH